MRERFESDEFKTYAETYRTKENPRAEELFRSEEIFRAPEFSSSTSLSTRRTLRRKNMRRQRSMLASIISAVGTATGAVMIVAAVLLSATKIFLSSVSATTHSLQFDMTIEWADNGELTALLTAEDERYEQTLSDNESSYTLVFTSLAPDTEYRLEIADGATVYFSGNYRTAPIEPLVPISESVTEHSVFLSFDASLLPESGYTVSFDGALQLFTLSADTPELLFGGLMPDTTYIISVIDPETEDVLFLHSYTTLTPEPSAELFSWSTTETSIDMTILVSESDSMTATLHGAGNQWQAALQEGENALHFDGLSPNTEYVLEVKSDENVWLSRTFRTAAAVPSIAPIYETILPDSISLEFDGATLPDSYIMYLNDVASGSISAEQTVITWTELLPETAYHVSAVDSHGNTVFEKTYTTLPHEISVTEMASESTMMTLRVELLVEHAKTPLTVSLGGQSQILKNGVNAVEFTGLSSDTEYALEVSDGENIYFTQTYRTNAYVQKLFPLEIILPESIELRFTISDLTADRYLVKLNGEEVGGVTAAQPNLLLSALTPGMSYCVTIYDDVGDTVFDKTYTTPPYEVSVTEITSENSMTTLRVELLVAHANAPLTASLGGQSQILQDGVNVVEFTGLSPDAEYTLEVRDGGNIYFTQTYRTQPYEQKLFPLETILPESIELQFEESELAADQYLVKLDGTEIVSINAAQPNLLLSGLTPETSYRVTIEDNIGNTVFDKTYTTPPYEISITETAWEATMTMLRVEITVEHADVPLTASLSGQSHVLQNSVNVIEFTGLSPSAVYAVYVRDEEGETYFFQTYRTQEYVQTLFPTEVFLSPNTIYLQFSEEDLTENGYEVYASSELYGRLSTSEPFIRLENLTPNTRYHISIPDGMGNLLLDKYYVTPYLIAEVNNVLCTPTSISLNLYLDMPSGEVTLMLTGADGDTQYKIFGPGEGGDVLFDGLTPMTDYTLTITDDRGTGHYTETFRTELSPELVSISGTELTLEFPWWQLEGMDGTVELFLNGASTGIFLPVENDAVTLSNLIPQTLYEVSAVANGVTWWQDSFTTPDIIIENAEAVVGSTDLNVSFLVQNPQGEPLRVVLLMGDMEIAAQTFTETRDGQMSFTASFETIPNGLYTVRLLRESDSLTLWQSEFVTAYSFIEVLGSPELSETEDGNELWVLPVMPGEIVEFRVTEKIQYFIAEEITAQCTATDGSGELIPMSESDANGTLFSFNVTEEMIGPIYELRLYRTVDGVPYLIERLYWKCRLSAI